MSDDSRTCREWVNVSFELPPKDGYYEITNYPQDLFDLGVAYYDGYGFKFEETYRTPDFWREYIAPVKRYGKI